MGLIKWKKEQVYVNFFQGVNKDRPRKKDHKGRSKKVLDLA